MKHNRNCERFIWIRRLVLFSCAVLLRFLFKPEPIFSEEILPDSILYSINTPAADEDKDLFQLVESYIKIEFSRKGIKLEKITEMVPLRATIEKNVIIGSIIFIDSYGNAITNITRELFGRVFEDRPGRIYIKSNKYFTEKISSSYHDEPVGELVTQFNSLELLEVSINGDNLSQLFGIETDDVVRVEVKHAETKAEGLF